MNLETSEPRSVAINFSARSRFQTAAKNPIVVFRSREKGLMEERRYPEKPLKYSP